jgi:hypothetical protein
MVLRAEVLEELPVRRKSVLAWVGVSRECPQGTRDQGDESTS